MPLGFGILFRPMDSRKGLKALEVVTVVFCDKVFVHVDGEIGLV